MLMLLFYADEERYVMDCDEIARILPKVALKKASNLPPCVTGLMNYQGQLIPVVDLVYLLTNHYAADIMSTRMIYCEGKNSQGKTFNVGFTAEKVTQSIDCKLSDFVETGIRLKEYPFLGGTITDNDGLIHHIKTKELLGYINRILFDEVKQ